MAVNETETVCLWAAVSYLGSLFPLILRMQLQNIGIFKFILLISEKIFSSFQKERNNNVTQSVSIPYLPTCFLEYYGEFDCHVWFQGHKEVRVVWRTFPDCFSSQVFGHIPMTE